MRTRRKEDHSEHERREEVTVRTREERRRITVRTKEGGSQ